MCTGVLFRRDQPVAIAGMKVDAAQAAKPTGIFLGLSERHLAVSVLIEEPERLGKGRPPDPQRLQRVHRIAGHHW